MLYEGNIPAVTETKNTATKIHYFISHNNFLGSFTFNGLHEVCHIGFIKTELAEIYIIDGRENFLRNNGKVFSDLIKYMNSKLV